MAQRIRSAEADPCATFALGQALRPAVQHAETLVIGVVGLPLPVHTCVSRLHAASIAGSFFASTAAVTSFQETLLSSP